MQVLMAYDTCLWRARGRGEVVAGSKPRPHVFAGVRSKVAEERLLFCVHAVADRGVDDLLGAPGEVRGDGHSEV